MRFPSLLLYWLLLLVPTVMLGIFGWRLLRHEEQRLDQAVETAREERADLVVENLALFLEEARASVIEGLGEIPPFDTADSLHQWGEAHPLVRHTFLWRPHAGVIPFADSTTAPASAFLTRHQDLLAPRGSWQLGSPLKSDRHELRDESSPREEPEVQIQEAISPRQELQRVAVDARQQNVALLRQRSMEVADTAHSFGAEPALAPSSPRPRSTSPARFDDAATTEFPRPHDFVWSFLPDLVPPVVLAWVEMQPGGEVRGAEISLDQLLTRTTAFLPRKDLFGDQFVLLDPQGHPHPADTSLQLPDSLKEWPISPLLSGWKLAVIPASGRTGGGGFFLLSSLLLTLLLVTILTGGSLLMWQAVRNRRDALRKSTFVSNVSHELRTPLTSIRLYAEMLAGGSTADKDRNLRYLDVICQEASRLTRLVNNVLDFSRLDQNKRPFRLEAINLLPLIEETVGNQHPRLEEAGLKVIVHSKENNAPIHARADRDALEQILLNLLDNAAKYAGHSNLAVEVFHEDGTAIITFADRGPGIPAVHRDRLFTQFHRVDDSLTAPVPGCGLGLNIARQLARGQKGDLIYRSRSGGGSIFRLQLPLCQP